MRHRPCAFFSSIIVFLCLLIQPGFGGSAESPYKNLSPADYEVSVEKNIFIPMRDGVKLAADIYKPKGLEKSPAIVVYIPYGKDYSAYFGGPYKHDLWYFAQRGYVGVFCDFRGTGSSEGSMPGYFNDKEWTDGYDLVEWIAEQPWCNGKVAMHGLSYGAIAPTRVASLNPPHLITISVQSSFANLFGDHFFGGGARITAPFVWISGPPNMAITYIRPPLYDDPRYPGRLEKIWEYHLNNNNYRTYHKDKWWNHTSYDEFWKGADLRSKYDRIKIPVFQCGMWFDRCRDIDEVFQNYIAFKRNKVPQKLIVYPYRHGLPLGPYGFELLKVELAWFDYWLKGKDTGIMDEPPVNIFVMGKNKYRYEQDWPIKRTKYVKYYLSPREVLSPKKEDVDRDMDELRMSSARFTYKPDVGVAAGPHGIDIGFRYIKDGFREQMDQRRDERSLIFTGKVLEEDLEVTGMPEIVFYATSTADDTNFCIKLCDVLPGGKSEMITRGWLNSSYRESNVNPRYPEDWAFKEPSKITPGKVYKYKVTLHNTSYVFKKGHRIRLAIASSDWPFIWPSPNYAENEVFFDKGEGAYILLPLVGQPAEPLPDPLLPPIQPALKIPEKPYPKIISGSADCWIEESLLNNTISYHCKGNSYHWESESSKIFQEFAWEIHLPKDKPADQMVTYEQTWVWEREGKEDFKFVIKYTCDLANGPQMDVKGEKGGPFKLKKGSK